MPIFSFREESLFYGRSTVTTAGNAVVILDGIDRTDAIIIKALVSNSGDVYVGDTNVDSSTGFPLSPGEGITITANNLLNPLFIDADTNGDSVAYIGGYY